MGKSFEIRPTGVAHVELLLPEEWAPQYPKARGFGAPGKVVEHYSWKKVTTSVSGFILGSPTIDHYGDMTVSVIQAEMMFLIALPDHKPPHGRRVHTYFQAPRLA